MKLDRLRARMPSLVKVPYRYLAGAVPYSWRRRSRVYRETRALLLDSQGWSRERLEEHRDHALRLLIGKCYASVPYYHQVFNARSLRPEDIGTAHDLRKLPFLDKEIVRSRFHDLLATNVPSSDRIHRSTGGTSGQPLVFCSRRGMSSEREAAFIDALWARASYQPGERLIALRNHMISGPRCWEYNPRSRQLVLDPFKLSPRNVGEYLAAMARSGIQHLHTYPSAALTLLRLAGKRGALSALPIRYILASSENVYPGQRETLESGFGARFFSWYGHSEQLVLAGECEESSRYHVFPEYGILELVDEEGEVIEEPGRRGEIVGTGFNNDAMPFLRYRTGDYAEYAPEATCSCGRAYPLLANISGRWRQEMIMNGEGGLISVTALNMHSEVFDHVRQFQFYQETQGEVVLRVIRGKGYTIADTEQLRQELMGKLGPTVRFEIAFVDEIPRTERGKHRFLVQKLPLEAGWPK